MKKYIYTSDVPSHNVIVVNGKLTQFSFYKGEVYELPEDSATVKSLEYQGLLIVQNIQKSSKNKK